MKDLTPFNLPMLAKVAQCVVSLPVSNARPERGGSCVKLLKTRLRNTMKSDMLNTLCQIKINGPEVGTSEFESVIDEAVTTRRSTKKRRKVSKASHLSGFRSATASSNAQEPSSVVADVGVQTDEAEQGLIGLFSALGLPEDDDDEEEES